MNFPEKFLAHLHNAPGLSNSAFINAHCITPPVSIRINKLKPVTDFTELKGVPWCSSGFYIPERPVFTLDPLLHAGCYYVQEASSMFLEHALKCCIDFAKPLKILDLCAAPGGKSTLVSNLLNSESILISNEVIRSRTQVLKENIIKWGNASVVITNNDPADFNAMEQYVDILIVDAPCSGSGLFRKDQEAMQEWSVDNVMLCSRRQNRILLDVLPVVKPGGILIYATCSYSAEENEDIVRKVLQHGFSLVDIPIDANWNIIKSENGYRFYPDKVQGEGFFISVMQKSGSRNMPDVKSVSGKIHQGMGAKNIHDLPVDWFNQAAGYSFYEQGKKLFACPEHIAAEITFLQQNLHVVKAGIFCGEIKGDDFVPTHELALSDLAPVNSVATWNLDKPQALRYLRKSEITETNVPASSMKESSSWVLVQYKHQNLGWIKMLKNRVNNYYPSAWRIKM
jgi:16S rRNA C967 or C1407 C5-methylase (RsmB/RsmF family)/NOL1/NOP2/fmu family ribosome biogenesis protein